jgi:calcineurin-like phosphoesterase family protein
MISIEERLQNVSPETRKEMETIWFTSDLHHGHPKIVPICNRPIYIDKKLQEYFKVKENAAFEKDGFWNPWADREWRDEMNKIHDQWLVKEIFNKWVKQKHQVFILGDLSLAKKPEAEKFVDRLNGDKFLILGNHDESLRTSTRFSQITQIKEFRFKRQDIEIKIDMCHYPLASWPSKPHGGWNLYGHVHGRYKNPGLSLDVGIDNSEVNYRPINLYEVALIMEQKEKDLGLGIYYDNGVD